MDWKKYYAKLNSYKKQLLKVCPTLNENSGIYILTREDKNGFKYAYIGQAKHLLTRLAEHLNSHKQHIDNSLYKRKLWSKENETGWGVDFIEYAEEELNAKEQEYIKEYANLGYQLYNKTAGSQGIGKVSIVETERKGYNKGLRKGYENAMKEVAKLFDKNLIATINGKSNKNKEKALEKFNNFINK